MRGRSRQKGRGGAPRFGRHGKQRPGGRERQGAREQPKVPGAMAGSAEGTRVGELRLHRDGYGFVVTARSDEDDVFVPAPFVGDALHTDLVEVRVLPGRGGKLEGRITKVVERRVLKLMGRLERLGGGFQVVADDRRVRHRIVVAAGRSGGARHGDNVVVRIVQYPAPGQPMRGDVIEVLGRRGEEATEKAAVIARHQLRREFPPQVQQEADAAFRRMDEGVIRSRRDLRDLPFVTIDGEGAQDFDDAVAVERADGGRIRLWVSIADVSYFVRPQTALDRAAYERATSVYFPGDCIPMLPEQLSNDLCSLKPDVDRLTMTAEMDIDPRGELVRCDFSRSVIQSRERMTYTAIRQILVDRDPTVRDRYRKLLPQIELMEECHQRLRQKRLRRGSIDFDLPEPEIVIDMQGEVADIVRAERHVGHMMIEDFMIAANEAVAAFLTERRAGCVYRVHEPPPPDKLREFSLLLHNLGYHLRRGGDVTPGALARVVEAFRGRPEERLVNHKLLRSMAQAVYRAENVGHFGLASPCYCHFTSPIRRYPDLVVHRLLAHALARGEEPPLTHPSPLRGEGRNSFPSPLRGEGRNSFPSPLRGEGRNSFPSPLRGEGRGEGGSFIAGRLQEVSEHCSRRERIAMEAEREMAKVVAAFFMQERVGERFEGIVSHVTKFGFFVELVPFFVEGLVPLDALGDDRYRFDEEGMVIRGRKKGRQFRIGDRLDVEVEEVDVPNREIIFGLA